MDFTALMSCRERLQQELRWGSWPPTDFTLDANREDLSKHFAEFTRGEAFAYTVLQPDGQQCLGCIYLERCDLIDGAQLAFWVIDNALDLEGLLVTEVLEWVHNEWAIDRVIIPLRDTNPRGIALAESIGLTPWENTSEGPLADHQCWLSAATDGRSR